MSVDRCQCGKPAVAGGFCQMEDEHGFWCDELEDDSPRCAASLWGFGCAYKLGHDGLHWTITDQGEYTWTEASEAQRRKAFVDARQSLENLIVALDGETEDLDRVVKLLATLNDVFPMYRLLAGESDT